MLAVIAGRKSKKVTLEKGKDYYWCTCGRSKQQPFCDGSHRGTSFKPKKFTAEKDGDAYLCLCKRTANAPFCDGTHRSLPDMEDLAQANGKGKSKTAPNRNTAAATPGAPSSTREEPTLAYIHQLAREGLEGHHGEMAAMGVPRVELPQWDDLQLLVAQMARKPLLDHESVCTELVIGPKCRKPLTLATPVFVSDMSFGSLSQNAKIALAKGAQMAGTGICSGEGGMLPEEQAENSRYLYEYASGGFGYDEKLLPLVQAFHFKGGQGAKTGTGGHLPGSKVTAKIASVRGLQEGQDAISPATFTHLHTTQDFKDMADRVREITGGVPIGFKLSANHIEEDIQFALDASADYIILDGRGGGTGAVPTIFRDNISVPTIPALARARRYLDKVGATHVTLIATGGLRVPADFVKALALGADGVAVSNSALQAIGCVAARMCNTNLCPAGIATQDPKLAALLNVDKSAKQLYNFLSASTHLISVLARACGHSHIDQFSIRDLTTWKKNMAELSGVRFAGVL